MNIADYRPDNSGLFQILHNAVHSFGLCPDVVFDVGAALGDFSLDCVRLFGEQCEVHAVEPLASRCYPSLLEIASKVPGVSLHETALLGSMSYSPLVHDGQIKIGVAGHPVSSSILDATSEQVSVPVTHARELFNGGYSRALLKVDVEGVELDILRAWAECCGASGVKAPACTELVIVECAIHQFRGDRQPLVHDIVHFMATKGFRVYDMAQVCRRPLDNSLALLDVAFARKDSAAFADERFAAGGEDWKSMDESLSESIARQSAAIRSALSGGV